MRRVCMQIRQKRKQTTVSAKDMQKKRRFIMDRKELEAKIIELVAMSYNKDASELSVDTKIKEELGGASLLMVGLVSEIENELDVLIQLQVAAACATIGELVDKVEEQM